MLLLAPPLFADGAKERVSAFVDAYRAGDVAAMRALWVPSTEEKQFRAAFDRAVRIGCLTVLRADVESVSDDAATIAFDVIDRRFATRRATLHYRDGKVVSVDWEADGIAAALVDGKAELDESALTPDVDRALANIAIREINRNNLPRARTAAELADRVAGMIGDRNGRALAIAVRGVLAGLGGDLASYVAATRQAYELAKDGSDPDVLARVINYIGRTHERQGDLVAARQEYDRAAAMIGQVEDPSLIGPLLTAINRVEYMTGDMANALRHAMDELELAESMGDETLGTAGEIAIGTAYLHEADYELAILHFDRAVSRAAAMKNDRLRARSLMELSFAYDSLGRDEDASRASEEALAIARRINDTVALTETLMYRGAAHLGHRRYADALRDVEESIEVCEGTRQPFFCTAQWPLRAAAIVERGDWQEGAAAAEDAAAKTKARGDTEAYIDAKTVAGRAYRLLGDRDRALAAYQDAIAATESNRGALSATERQQVLYFARHANAFVEAIDLLVDAERVEEALELAERAKGRALLDILAGGRTAASPLTPDERRRENALEQRLANLNRQLLQETKPERTRDLKAQLEDARAEHDTFEAGLHIAHPRLRTARAEFQPLRAGEIRALLAPDETVLEYVAGERRSFVFIITRDAVHVTTLPTSAALTKAADAFAGAVSMHALDAGTASRALAKIILPGIANARELAIVPDGPLWRVPFEALKLSDGRYLIEKHAVFYVPSMSVLHEITTHREPEAGHTLLAVGNPKLSLDVTKRVKALYRNEALGPLPDAEAEVRELRRLYGGEGLVLTGAAARESAIKPELPRYRILHFATHGRFDDANPMYSHLVLASAESDADDGLLEGWELMNADLHADLAVLSACDTARGRFGAGEGLIGMSWALFAAGCPSSVLSQWSVSSESTAKLMVAFHRRLVGGASKAEALRGAKLELLKNEHFKHPFYWSAFVLLGAP